MKSKSCLLIVVSLVVFLFSAALSESALRAVGVDFNGYFRTRYNLNYNLDLDRSKKPNARNFADLRFRLDPTFFVTEKLRIKTSFNILDAAAGSQNFRGISFDTPASNNHRLVNNTNTGSGALVGKPLDDQESWVYGGAFAPDAAMETAGLGPVQMRRAWLEYETPYGILKAGRMPFHLGLGLYANAGDGLDQEIGTTRDRLAFETSFGAYYLIPSISWFYEGLIDRGADDVYELAFNMGRKNESGDLGLYISYIGQANADGETNNGSLENGDTKFWIVDFYGNNKFGRLELAGEVALFTGKYVGRDLIAVNAALRSDWQATDKLSLLTEVGYSSGTSASDVAGRDLKTIAFNRDYNLSYLLFEEAIPGGINRGGTAYSPHSGALSNAVYGRLYSQFKWVDWFHPAVQVLVPYAMKKVSGSGSKFYGIEYNLITTWPFDDYVSAELLFAHFIPGGLFKAVSKEHSAMLVRSGLNLKF